MPKPSYETMWFSLRHALIERSSEEPDNSFYPAITLLMTGMEYYAQSLFDKMEEIKKEASDILDQRLKQHKNVPMEDVIAFIKHYQENDGNVTDEKYMETPNKIKEVWLPLTIELYTLRRKTASKKIS